MNAMEGDEISLESGEDFENEVWREVESENGEERDQDQIDEKEEEEIYTVNIEHLERSSMFDEDKNEDGNEKVNESKMNSDSSGTIPTVVEAEKNTTPPVTIDEKGEKRLSNWRFPRFLGSIFFVSCCLLFYSYYFNYSTRHTTGNSALEFDHHSLPKVVEFIIDPFIKISTSANLMESEADQLVGVQESQQDFIIPVDEVQIQDESPGLFDNSVETVLRSLQSTKPSLINDQDKPDEDLKQQDVEKIDEMEDGNTQLVSKENSPEQSDSEEERKGVEGTTDDDNTFPEEELLLLEIHDDNLLPNIHEPPADSEPEVAATLPQKNELPSSDHDIPEKDWNSRLVFLFISVTVFLILRRYRDHKNELQSRDSLNDTRIYLTSPPPQYPYHHDPINESLNQQENSPSEMLVPSQHSPATTNLSNSSSNTSQLSPFDAHDFPGYLHPPSQANSVMGAEDEQEPSTFQVNKTLYSTLDHDPEPRYYLRSSSRRHPQSSHSLRSHDEYSVTSDITHIAATRRTKYPPMKSKRK